MNNSSILPEIVAVLARIALGASAVGREIAWQCNGEAVFVWDALPESVDDSPIFVADNVVETVEHLTDEFAHYL